MSFVAAIYDHVASRREKYSREVGEDVVDGIGRMVSTEGIVVGL